MYFVFSEPSQRPTSITNSDGAGSSKSEGAQEKPSSSSLIKHEPGVLPVQISCVVSVWDQTFICDGFLF